MKTKSYSPNFNLNMTNLQSLNPTDSGGETIDLPITTGRQVATIIRVGRADNLVMAGMVSSTDNNSRQGIPSPGDARIPMYATIPIEIMNSSSWSSRRWCCSRIKLRPKTRKEKKEDAKPLPRRS